MAVYEQKVIDSDKSEFVLMKRTDKDYPGKSVLIDSVKSYSTYFSIPII